RDAIEALLAAGDGPGALVYVDALEHYTQAEPLPWSQLFAARGRLLAQALHGVNDNFSRLSGRTGFRAQWCAEAGPTKKKGLARSSPSHYALHPPARPPGHT